MLAGGIVDAINSPDDAAIPRLLDAKLSTNAQQPRDEILAYLRGIREQGGGVTVGASRITPRGNAVVQLWGRRVDAGVEVAVFPDPADSTRLLRVALNRPLRRGADFRPFPRRADGRRAHRRG